MRFGDFSLVEVTKAQVRVQTEEVRMREAVHASTSTSGSWAKASPVV